MTVLRFEVDIDPLYVELAITPADGPEVVHRFQAIPDLGAEQFEPFMAHFAKVPPLLDKIKEARGDTDDETGKVGEGGDLTAMFAAYREFIKVSLEGLDMVLLPADKERLEQLAADPTTMVPATKLATIYSGLVNHYMSGGKEAKEAVGEGPSDGASESPPSSDTTGGSSEGNSSTEPDSPNSEAGPTTT